MRAPKQAEIGTIAAWILMTCACAVATVGAKIMSNCFLIMYGEGTYPRLTEAFLSLLLWLPFVPPIAAAVSAIVWRTQAFQRTHHILIIAMHFISFVVLSLALAGVIRPLLTTTFRIGP